jgi:glucose/arabinose dehydrogenase
MAGSGLWSTDRRSVLRYGVLLVLIPLLVGLVAPASVRAFPQPDLSWPSLALTPVAAGFSQPTVITHAGDGSGRLFVVERQGRIKIIKNGAVLATPFLDISSVVLSSEGGEQGLLGLAFPPNYAAKGYFYINFTRANAATNDTQSGETVIARVRLKPGKPDEADPASLQDILVIDQPFTNHNGGQLAFGPNDGYLYIGMGDGGSGGDPNGYAQNLDPLPGRKELLGKLLRIDVECATCLTTAPYYAIPATNPTISGHPQNEIWARGFRNLWRFSFDRSTRDLYMGDVGHNAADEVDFQPATSTGGENYGWVIMEGTYCFNFAPCDKTGLVKPVVQFDHAQGCSITGGYVYRGPSYPRMQGVYFYGELCTGKIWGLKRDGARWRNMLLLDSTAVISTFGEDEAGELYVADIVSGTIYRITDATEAGRLFIAPHSMAAVVYQGEVWLFGRNAAGELWYQETVGGNFTSWKLVAANLAWNSRPKPVVVGNDLYVFYHADLDDLRYVKRSNNAWGPATSLGGVVAGSPEAAVDGDGDLILIVLNPFGNLWYQRLTANGTTWSNWLPLDGALTGSLSLTAFNGDLYLFGSRFNGPAYTRRWSRTADAWQGWTDLGMPDNLSLRDQPVSLTYNGFIHSYWVTEEGAVWRRSSNGISWDAWTSLGGVVGEAVDAAASPAALFLGGTGIFLDAWYKQLTTEFGNWHPLHGTIVTGPEMVAVGDDVYLFVENAYGTVWYRRWTGSAWENWQTLGGILALDEVRIP